MYACIDAHREDYGVEPICHVLGRLPCVAGDRPEIAPSGYYRHRQQQADATCRSARAQHDGTV